MSFLKQNYGYYFAGSWWNGSMPGPASRLVLRCCPLDPIGWRAWRGALQTDRKDGDTSGQPTQVVMTVLRTVMLHRYIFLCSLIPETYLNCTEAIILFEETQGHFMESWRKKGSKIGAIVSWLIYCETTLAEDELWSLNKSILWFIHQSAIVTDRHERKIFLLNILTFLLLWAFCLVRNKFVKKLWSLVVLFSNNSQSAIICVSLFIFCKDVKTNLWL